MFSGGLERDRGMKWVKLPKINEASAELLSFDVNVNL